MKEMESESGTKERKKTEKKVYFSIFTVHCWQNEKKESENLYIFFLYLPSSFTLSFAFYVDYYKSPLL
jgi:hypothetical protein